LFLCRYYDVLFSYKILGNSHDNVYLLGPVFKKINALTRSGQTPLYLEELVGGLPFYNSAMFSFTYPFFFFGLIDYGIDLDVLRTLTLIIVFHLFILYVGSIVLLRVIGFTPLISIVSAFGIILCLNTAYNTPWIIAIAGYAWIPLFFAGVIATINKSKSYLGPILLAIGSLGFLAKPAQTAILAIFFGLILTLVGLWVKRAELRSIIPKLLLAAVLIIGINLPGIVQVYIDFSEAIRFSTGGPIDGSTKLPLSVFKSQVDFSDSLNYLLYIKKRICVGHPYIGPVSVLSLFLSIYFIAKRKASWAIVTFLMITLATIVFVFGKELPTFWIHYNTPLLNKIRESSRFLFITNIGLTVLTAYVFSTFRNSWADTKVRFLSTAFFYLALLVGIIQSYIGLDSFYFSVATGFAILIAFLFYKYSDSFYRWMISIVLILVGLSFLVPNGRYGKLEKGRGWHKEVNTEALQILDQLDEKLAENDEFRCSFFDTKLSPVEWANKGLYEGFRSLSGSIVVLPKIQFEQMRGSQRFRNYNRLWGSKWLIYDVNHKLISREKKSEIVVKNENHIVYKDDAAFPRVYFPDRVVSFDGDFKRFRHKLESYSALPRLAFMPSTEMKNKNVSKLPNGENKVLKSSFHNNQFIIETANKSSGLLVINEYYSEHWNVKVNDASQDLLKVNMNQMGILLDVGKNHIEMDYRPKPFIYFHLAQKLTFILLLLLMGFYLFSKFRSKKV